MLAQLAGYRRLTQVRLRGARPRARRTTAAPPPATPSGTSEGWCRDYKSMCRFFGSFTFATTRDGFLPAARSTVQDDVGDGTSNQLLPPGNKHPPVDSASSRPSPSSLLIKNVDFSYDFVSLWPPQLVRRAGSYHSPSCILSSGLPSEPALSGRRAGSGSMRFPRRLALLLGAKAGSSTGPWGEARLPCTCSNVRGDCHGEPLGPPLCE